MQTTEKKGRFKEIRDLRMKNFLALTLAGIVNSFGVSLFLFPVKLYDSGISGLSMLLDQITPSQFTLSLFLLLLNIPIFLFGLKKQGLLFTIYSLYTVLVYSLASFLIMHVLPIDLDFVSPLAGSDLLLCAVFGGLISGTGSGLTIRFGGAIDGIDVMSVIFAKKLGISLGTFVMLFNTLLYIICGMVIRSWILPLYSIVTYFVGSKTVDFIVEGFDRAMCAMIVTNQAEKISHALSETFSQAALEGRIANVPYMIGCTLDDMGALAGGIDRFCLERQKVGGTAYAYHFDRRLPTDGRPDVLKGAFHSSELWYMFKSLRFCWRPFVDGDYDLAEQMITCWANFAAYGNPNGEKTGPWTPFTEESPQFMVFKLDDSGAVASGMEVIASE